MPDDIYEAIRPLYYTSKIFGLAPFSFNKTYPYGKRCKKFKISFFNLLYSTFIIVVSLIASAIIFGWRIQKSYTTDKHVTVILTNDNVVCLNSSLALLPLLMAAAFNKTEMFRLVTGIARVDNALLSRPKFVYKKTHTYVLLQVVYLFAPKSYSTALTADFGSANSAARTPNNCHCRTLQGWW
jgi:hypothetical protein